MKVVTDQNILEEIILKARANQFIDEIQLPGLLAIDPQYDSILPVLWKRFELGKRKSMPDITTIDGRAKAWWNLICRWTTGTIAGVPGPPICMLPWRSGKSGWIDLIDLKDFFHKWEIPLPRSLYEKHEIKRDPFIEEALWEKHIDPIIKAHNLKTINGEYFEYQFIEKCIDTAAVDRMLRKTMMICLNILFPKPETLQNRPFSGEPNCLYGGEDDFIKAIMWRLRDAQEGPQKFALKSGGEIDLRDVFRDFLDSIFNEGTLPEFLALLHFELLPLLPTINVKTTSKAPPPINPARGGGGVHRYIEPKPNYNYWVKFSYWSLSEASCLICACDPKHEEKTRTSGARLNSKLKARVDDTFEIIHRAYESHEFKTPNNIFDKKCVAPDEILKWAVKKGIEPPNQLRDLILNIRAKQNTESLLQQCPNDPINESQRNMDLGDDELLSTLGKNGAEKRWKAYKKLKEEACKMADEKWKNGEEALHDAMTVYLIGRNEFKKLKPFRKALLKAIKEVAHKYNRVRGIKKKAE
ncbi:MAG: hypothetical protein M0036_12350 [Desulfobacteraceae bacterium]|nr:hypothetical protein [Desulfobacteraceae bacterium]